MPWTRVGQVIDLRRSVRQGSVRGSRWTPFLYLALGVFAVSALVELGFAMATAASAREVPFEVSWEDDEGPVVGVLYGAGWQVEPGDVLVAVDGEDISLAGGRARFRSLIRDKRAFTAAFARPDHEGSEADRATQRFEVRVELVRRPHWASVASLVWPVAMLVVAVIGMLAVRAPGNNSSKRTFLTLCLITGAGQVLSLWSVWQQWLQPVAEAWEPFGTLRDTLRVVGMLAWCFVFGLALRSFLRSLAPEVALAPRHRPPRRYRRTLARLALLSLSVATIITAATAMSNGEGRLVVLAFRMFALTLFLLAVFGLSYVVALVPMSVYRSAGEIRAGGGEAAQRTEAVLVGARAGAALIGVLVLLVIIWIEVALPAVSTRLGAVTAGTVNLALGTVADLVVTTAILLPFLGVFLAVTGSGLWEADTILKKATAWSGLSVLFVLSWAGIGQLVEAIVSGGVGEFGSAVVAGGLVTVLRRPFTDRVTRAVFPASRDLRASLETLSSRLAGDAEDPGEKLMQALGAKTLAILAIQSDSRARLVWSRGSMPPVSLVAAAVLPAFREFPDAIVTTENSALLVVRLGESSAVRGIVLIDPARGTRFYDSAERRLVAMTLNLLGPRLLAARVHA